MWWVWPQIGNCRSLQNRDGLAQEHDPLPAPKRSFSQFLRAVVDHPATHGRRCVSQSGGVSQGDGFPIQKVRLFIIQKVRLFDVGIEEHAWRMI